MKKLLISLIILSLTGCTASIGPNPPATRVHTTTVPAVSSTTYSTPVARTTVTQTSASY